MPENTAVLHAGLLTALRERLNAGDFLERQRQSAKAFTRPRCLPFLVVVVVFLLNLVKRALQDELDAFFNLERGAAVAAEVVTKSALFHAQPSPIRPRWAAARSPNDKTPSRQATKRR